MIRTKNLTEHLKLKEPRIKVDNSIPDGEIRFNGTFELGEYRTFYVNQKAFDKILKDLTKILREEKTKTMATPKKAAPKKKTAKKGKK